MLALKAENISKQYRLGQVGTGTLTHDLNRFWHRVRGKENPYLKIGEVNDRTSKGSSDYVWSLQDINFEIEQGDAVGIIGRNGAGKSTLLKILSKVTQPTTGRIYTNGRIASLLEVGTGFHPEMTGRENVYLNGAILGMTKKEITRKFDEIVDFSGVERYIDTPVKRYSSGMYVRLAFAVAAHLESEILIVDEVLAVGDAEFQKKCLGKMGDVQKGEGRTILFVSHNMTAIQVLCNKGIYLNNGKIKSTGNINKIISHYNREQYAIDETYIINVQNPEINFESLDSNTDMISISDILSLKFKILSKQFSSDEVFFDIAIYNSLDQMVIHSKTEYIRKGFKIEKNSDFILEYTVQNANLSPGTYKTTIYAYEMLKGVENVILWIDNIIINTVSSQNPYIITDATTLSNLDDLKSITYPKYNLRTYND
ncbi:ABC transporter ATP-binding protein [Chryseobacterium sp.]|uniref:ABC transporter ATP-binding protein n=1 Tax=Chryseobacterium sp. TaxID=1871047 RepID=UPI0028A211E3|nr:ABC transporter ATP-binding protein [Chryseobacterium sp.]